LPNNKPNHKPWTNLPYPPPPPPPPHFEVQVKEKKEVEWISSD
ncbi:hypothetical protein A2U01_0090538, partial [Trifolium medium]|nr:hypothetical protein [Trifolium medium]